MADLCRARTMRSGRCANRAGRGRCRIVDAVSIRERLAEVEDRTVPARMQTVEQVLREPPTPLVTRGGS